MERLAEITTDGRILNTIQGVSVNFTGALHGSTYRQTLLTSDEGKVVEADLARLEQKNVICQADHVVDEYVSTIFLRPKKDGSHKIILNLKHLNKSIEKVHFKLDSHEAEISLRKKDCCFASLDIRGACYSISDDESCKNVCRFCFQDKLFECSGLPRGY